MKMVQKETLSCGHKPMAVSIVPGHNALACPVCLNFVSHTSEITYPDDRVIKCLCRSLLFLKDRKNGELPKEINWERVRELAPAQDW
jgi:hypothetical protein